MCHDWLEQLPESEREKVNNELREYKNSFRLGIAIITTEEISNVQEIELPEITEDYKEIPVFDYTEKEYLEHKEKRNERAYKRFEVER